MAQMGELNEACVLDNLKQRYQSNLIYVNNEMIFRFFFYLFINLFIEFLWFVLSRRKSLP